jgi:hypothetical protein
MSSIPPSAPPAGGILDLLERRITRLATAAGVLDQTGWAKEAADIRFTIARLQLMLCLSPAELGACPEPGAALH